jgi:integrase
MQADEEPSPDTLKFKRKPAKLSLTKRAVEALPVPPLAANGKPGQEWTYDSNTPHLAVCVFSSGARTWYWCGRGCDGRVLHYKLGRYPEITPEQAKKLAGKVSAQIAEGIDPRELRYRTRTELTLDELFGQFLEQHAKLHKKTWEDDANQFRLYCSSLKPRALSTITQGDVSALHARVGKEHGHYAANRVLALLSKMFSFAVSSLGFPGRNPAKGVQRFRERSRDRFLSADELRRFFEALAEEPELFQDFFKMLLLTGQRRGNVQAMRFEQLDFIEKTWRIPETKNGRPLTVHLAREALEILQRRLAASGGNVWVFGGGRKNRTGHLTEPKGAWKRVCTRAGLQNIRPHDLRRTMGSWQAATGASLPVIGKSLGHQSQQTTQIYARLNIDPVRQAVDNAVAAMMAAANGNKEEK